MKWLYRIIARILPCRHKWKIISTTSVYEDESDKRPIKIIYAIQCIHCGDITTRNAQ